MWMVHTSTERNSNLYISQGVSTLLLSLPLVPLKGWEVVAADNYKEKYVQVIVVRCRRVVRPRVLFNGATRASRKPQALRHRTNGLYDASLYGHFATRPALHWTNEILVRAHRSKARKNAPASSG